MDLGLWRDRDRVIEWDVHSYYAYLPALFIYDDIRLEHEYRFDDDYFLFWPNYTASGKPIIKMTMGVAVFYSPFFFVGHLLAKVMGYPADGWSPPYKILLLIGGLCYFLIGLLAVRRILERTGFSDTVIAIVILLVGGGTNLFCYATHSGTMSHVYSFTLIALFMLMTLKWYDGPTFRTSTVLGLLAGAIILIRPTNAVILLLFFLIRTTDLRSMIERLKFFLEKWPLIVWMALLAFLIWIPQLVYWKTITGHYFFNPYVGEGFFFDHPHVFEGLFSFRKGWYVYTPIMFFATIGIILLRGRLEGYRNAVLASLIVAIYITFSWWCWWYGGSLGQRCMIDLYAIMSIPLAAFVALILTQNVRIRVLSALVGAFFIWLNVFQIEQFENEALHYDAMTMQLYFKQFGKVTPISGSDDLLSYPDYERARTTGRRSVVNVRLHTTL
ncbi:MAG: hypothetical protein IPI91_00650 [Flavobacteriales bacterium]|nr:hypothetical protein [Flavobacteriales bacterium]